MSTPANASRPRRGVVAALIVVATITGVAAIFAIWVQRQVLNEDNWTASSTRLLEDAAVRTAVSGYLVDQLYAKVDVAGELRASLPPRVKGLAAPAAGGLRNVAGNLANEALQRPRVQTLWETANRQAHRSLMRVLDGGGPAVSTANGAVTLDLGGLLGEVAGRTGLGDRLAAKLPPGSAQITVLRSNELRAAQNISSALRPLAIFLTALSLGLFAAAIWLAQGWRRQALRSAGVGLIVAGIAALIVRRVGGNQVVDALASTAAIRPAAESVWRIETSLLADVAQATIAYGVVAVLAAWLAGPTVVAVGARRMLAPYLRDPAYAWGGLAVLMLLVLVWAPTQALRQPVTAVLLLAIVAGGFEALRRATAREFPDAERHAGAGLAGLVGRLRGGGSGGRGAQATDPTADSTARLERAAALHERGALTDEEFTAEKDAILAAH